MIGGTTGAVQSPTPTPTPAAPAPAAPQPDPTTALLNAILAGNAQNTAAAEAQLAAPVAPSVDVSGVLGSLSQEQSQANDALQASLDASNQQAAKQLQMQYEQQIADLYSKEAQSQTTADTTVGQLRPQLSELQAQHDLTQANYLTNQQYADASLGDRLASHGLLNSGINLGAQARFYNAQNQTIAGQNLQLQQQQDAISRAIAAAQQTNATNQSTYNTQIQSLSNANKTLAPQVAASGASA